MKYVPTFESFLAESYTGPEAVEFNRVMFDSIMDKNLYITLSGKIYTLYFGSTLFMSDDDKNNWKKLKKELNTKNFDTDLEFSSDFSKRLVVLNGFYDITLAPNRKVELHQDSKGVSLQITLPNSVLKKGNVKFSSDRPD